MLLVYKLRPPSDLETGSRSELCSSRPGRPTTGHDKVLFGKPGENLVAAKSPNNGAVPPLPRCRCKASDDVTDNVPGRLLWREHEQFGSGPGFGEGKKNLEKMTWSDCVLK